MRNILYILAIFAALAISCDSMKKEIDFNDKDIDKLLVAHSYLGNDSILKVLITSSSFILDTANVDYIKDADVYITVNGGSEIKLDYRGNGEYFSNLKATEGNRYTLQASCKGFANDIYAETTIPQAVPFEITDTAIINGEDYLENGLRVKLKFSEPVGENYYRLCVYKYDTINYYDKDLNEIKIRRIVNLPLNLNNTPVVKGKGDIPEEVTPLDESPASANPYNIFHDRLLNGKEVTIDFTIMSFTGYDDLSNISIGYDGESVYPDGKGEAKKSNVIISLHSITKDYFQFATSITQGSDGMFMSQPTPVFSNVEGGIGLFTGYSAYNDSVYCNLPNF